MSEFEEGPLAEMGETFAHVIEYVMIAKVMDKNGDVGLVQRSSPTIASWEAVGMLACALEGWQTPIARELGNWDHVHGPDCGEHEDDDA